MKGEPRLSNIGETLRSAREAQRKSIQDAAAATRIRSSYLTALEEERFGALGGNVYARGFLRSYATYLGLDPEPLLDAYRRQERPDVPVFEHAPRPIGNLEGTRRRPSWMAVGIVVASIVLLASVWSLLRPEQPGARQPPFVAQVTTTTRALGAGASTSTTSTTRKPEGVVIEISYSGPCWTKATIDGKEQPPETPGAGDKRTFKGDKEIDLILGAPSVVRMKVNGKDIGAPSDGGAVFQGTFTPDSSEPREAGEDRTEAAG